MALDYNTINGAWEEFENTCLSGASRIQVEEMKKAFYMGAASVLGLMYAVGSSDVSDDAATALFVAWREECDIFVNGVLSGMECGSPGDCNA